MYIYIVNFVKVLESIVLILVFLSIDNQGFSQTSTWTGTTDTDWHKVCNWSPSSIPTSSDFVVIPDPASGNYPVIEGNAQCKDLDITATSGNLEIKVTSGGNLCNASLNGGACTNTPILDNGGCISNFLPNPSFENFSCCPSGNTQMSCVNSWQDATSAGTSDYWNTCGSTNIVILNPPPMPLPDGNGYLGFYAAQVAGADFFEQVGACLVSNLSTGVNYTFSYNIAGAAGASQGPISLAIYGTTNCANLPITVAGTACPSTLSGSWVKLGNSATFTPSNAFWTSGNFSFTAPSNIAAVIITGNCGVGGTSIFDSYFYLDDLSLN